MIDLKLDTVTHDLLVETDLILINNLDYIEQKIKITLWFFFAEWFLDTTVGIKYMEFVFVKNPNLIIVDSLFKVALLEIDEVKELIAFDSIFDKLNRKYTMTYTVRVETGETITDSQEVTL